MHGIEQNLGDFSVADDGSVGLNVFAKTKNKKNYGKETHNLAEWLQGASVYNGNRSGHP